MRGPPGTLVLVAAALALVAGRAAAIEEAEQRARLEFETRKFEELIDDLIERCRGPVNQAMRDAKFTPRDIDEVVLVGGSTRVPVRDGATARAASDALFTDKKGKVICTLNIASVDLHSGSIVLTRNNPSPMFICRDMHIDRIDSESIPFGTSRDVRPSITEIEIQTGLTIILYTDGLVHAGERRGQPMNTMEVLQSMLEDMDPNPQNIADTLLAHAVMLDDNRPADDISVVVLKVASRIGDNVRRMTVRLPIEGFTNT